MTRFLRFLGFANFPHSPLASLPKSAHSPPPSSSSSSSATRSRSHEVGIDGDGRELLLALAVLTPAVVLQPPLRREHLVAVRTWVLSRLVHIEDVTLHARLCQVDLLAVGTGVA